MGQGLMVKLDSIGKFESRPKFDPGERYRPSGCGSGSSMARLLVGSDSKGLCDVGSIDSPTSPLDLMMFPRLRDLPPRKNSWDCMKVGLRSIVDSIDDNERESCRGTLRSSYNKSIIFGPKSRLKEFRTSNSSVVFEIGETQFGADQRRNFLSCSVDSCSFGNRCPSSIGKSHGSDMELSEDYTCVISHGPGATTRTTHIFDDRVLECPPKDGASTTIETRHVEEGNPSLDPVDGFLRTCYACKKSLEDGKDIYIYRGDKAFCREECRVKEIVLEGDPEEILKDSSDSKQYGRGDGHF